MRLLTRLTKALGIAASLGALAAVPLSELPSERQASARSVLPELGIDLPAAAPGREPGYQLVTDGGDVLPFGAAAAATAPVALPNPARGIARTPTGAGSWTVTDDGGVITAGDAPFFGSLAGKPLRRPIVGIAGTPTGRGYWLVSADGGIFTFGDARFHGAVAGKALQAPIVSVASTPTGRGYWLVSGDGGVFTFGDARFHGAVTKPLQRRIVGMTPTPTGRGYWLVSGDGGVFTFGDARFHGRPEPTQLRSDVVGIAPSRSGRGYWIAAADGGVFTFGDAPFLGSSGGAVWGKVVGITAGHGQPLPPAAKSAPRTRYGHDISWPQCDGPYPAPGYGFAVIGVTGGRPFTRNRCLADEWRWATAGGSGGALYVNLATPTFGEPAAMDGPAGRCDITHLQCQVYNHSANNMLAALAYARSVGANAPMWWLDVEVLNRWSPLEDLNHLTVHAAAETLRKEGIKVGVYSTALMWKRITGGAQMDLPVWIAGAPTDAAAPSWCDRPDKNFTGAGIWMVQSLPIHFDVNWACTPLVKNFRSVFAFRQ